VRNPRRKSCLTFFRFHFLFSIEVTMKISFVAALLSTLVSSQEAWVAPKVHTPTSRSSLVILSGSRAADKRVNKRAWLEKRGISDCNSDTLVDATTVMTEIIGSGRIGALLSGGGDCKVLGREDSIDPDGTGPILIATRNDALEGIVDTCPENRRKDLVFLQNGYLDNFLEKKCLLENTQALLYLSVTAKGVDAVDGVTKVNPEGLTAATGLHAQALADRLAALNLKCNVVSPQDYRPAMFEKLM
jgi:hypothetical protein